MKKILITTTDSLYGWEIEAYLKPVFASVVIGSNIFSDISASFSDFFGGRSGSYEKRLQLIKDNAIAILTSKATELGANCILGLKIDVDEISGKNMQMFMITAGGTAVIARNAKTQTNSRQIKEIDKDVIKEKANIIRLAKKFRNFEAEITVDELRTIAESRSREFKEFAIAKLKATTKANSGETELLKLYKDYFAGIDPNEAMSVLYPALLAETNENLIKLVVAILKENDLVNYGEIHMLLQSSLDHRKIALDLLLAYKPSYDHDDIQAVEEMIGELKQSFPKVITMSTKKGFLSSAEKEVWVCVCNTSNSVTSELCSSCYKDHYGFGTNELRPQRVIDVLSHRLEALRDLL